MLVIPDALIEDIRRGRVVLLLGAGASRGARNAAGNEPPDASQLKNCLADRFLGGRHKDATLAWVAELAISETDLPTVQDFIADLLRGLRPASFHYSLASFRWRGVASTNYDLVLETAYSSGSPAQTLVPCISDRDRVDEKLRSADNLALLKLHGCITRTHDPDLPLILTAEQYITHRDGRKYIFTTFENWAYEYPVLFVGSSGQDADLRALLMEVSRRPEMRPRYYLLKPGSVDTEKRFWDSKRVTLIDGTLEQMMGSLEVAIPKSLRPLLAAIRVESPIRRRFVVNEEISDLLEKFLTIDVEYIHDSLPISTGTPAQFYRGFDLGWYPILANLDVPRELVDTLLNDIVIRAEGERPVPAELYVVKAEAGAGKSILLRRLAWEAATQADSLCLYQREFGVPRYEALKELHRVTRQRIFLFVDGAAENASVLASLVTAAQQERLPLTVFTAERVNTWNTACERLAPLLTDSYPLRYLSHAEIEKLVTLLTTHDCLGPHLTGKSQVQCIQQFEEQAGRQLLVALHEATMGLPFEDILIDEYNGIQPLAAQQLYLTVCVLNRLNVPVRAGLIARVHDLRFEDFRERLFLPLEHVVKAEEHPGTHDYLYSARHPEIAQIVFQRLLHSPKDRYNEYVRIIANLNLAYGTDRTSLRGLLKARALHELFPNYQDVKSLFETASAIGPREAFILQQQANYERIRPDGNLTQAEKMLQQARELDPRDTTLIHTLAEIKRTRAENTLQQLEREKYRNEARSLLRPLLNDPLNDRYARHTMVKLAVDDLRDTLLKENTTDREIDGAVRSVEDLLQRGLQQYPADQFLLTTEADYSQLLQDHERSFSALKRAFEANRRDTYIASRLARLHEQRGSLDDARKIIHDALQANRGDHQLNFQYAEVLRRQGESEQSVLLYHYRRAFTKWDTNYEAQFWFARYSFESTNPTEREESKETFKRLRSAPMSFDSRRQVRDSISSSGSPRTLFGTIVRLDYKYGFVALDGAANWVFFHRNESDPGAWENWSIGVRVMFNIGFTFNGAVALNLNLV